MIKKDDVVYYSRILPPVGIYEVCDLKVRTVGSDYFVGFDKRDKRAYLLNFSDIGEIAFFNRDDAVKKVITAEESNPHTIKEIFYEEY